MLLVQNGKLLHICYEDGSIEASVRWTTVKLVGVKVGDTVCLPRGTEVTVTSFASRGRVKADNAPTAVLLQNKVTGGRLGINPENSRPKDTPSIWWPSSPPQLQLSMRRDVSPHRVTSSRCSTVVTNPSPNSKPNPNPNPNPNSNPNPDRNQARRASWRSRGSSNPLALIFQTLYTLR